MTTRNNFSKKFIFSLRYFLLENIKIALSNKETNKQPKYIFFIFIELIFVTIIALEEMNNKIKLKKRLRKKYFKESRI